MRLTACVIAKNEERSLPHCLESVSSIVDEMIVVDTGSTDQTVEIAKSFGAKVYHFEWVNDFAKAKNFAISKATGKWIIFLDADEYFTPESVPLVPRAIKEAEEKGCDFIICLLTNYDVTSKQVINSVHHVRIFRNHPDIRYIGAIHERVVKNGQTPKALNALGLINIIHTGYSAEIQQQKAKGERNIKLLLEALKRDPDNADLYFYLGDAYLAERKYEEALKYAEKAQQLGKMKLMGIREKNYLNIINCMIQLKYDRNLIIDKIRKAVTEFPQYPDFYIYLGDCYTQENRFFDALVMYEKGMELVHNAFLSQSNVPHRAPAILDKMGKLYYNLDLVQDSVRCFVQALKIDLYFYSSLCNLVALFKKYESHSSTIDFLAKLYDHNRPKDLLYLIRAALQNNIPLLAEHYYHLTPQPVKDEFKEEYVQILYQKKAFSEAAKQFLALYREKQSEDIAVFLLASVMLSEDKRLFEEAIETIHAPLKEVLEKLRHPQQHLDKSQETLAIKLLTNMLTVVPLETCGEYVSLANLGTLQIHLGDVLFGQERYEEAILLYTEGINGMEEKDRDRVQVLLKIAECEYKLGHFESAKAALKQVKNSSPENYLAYSLLLNIYKRTNDRNGFTEQLREAIKSYPDSHYFQLYLQEG